MPEHDLSFMRRAFALALLAKGRTSPNPMVGAVLVKEGRVVGEGYHAFAGGDHAEVRALKAASFQAEGATLYVNLEPCCHVGRTPPCTEALIRAGIKKVIASTLDPNPLVSGKGVERLKEAGIEVEVGLLAEEARRLNEAFFAFIATGRPFVILKAASSLDGRIATRAGESRWITGEEARRRVHELRDEVDAVLVGIGTVLKDDPALTVRLGRQGTRNPLRVIVDAYARLPLEAKALQDPAKTLVAASREAPGEQVGALRRRGAEVVLLDGQPGQVSLTLLMEELGKRGIVSVMIEGGAEINASALAEGIVDKVLLFLAPLLIGGREAPSAVGGRGIERLSQAIRLKDLRIERLGEDLLIEGYINKPATGDSGEAS